MPPIEHPRERQVGSIQNYIVFYGRLAPEKGIPILIEAIRRTRGLRLEIYGLDPLDREEELRSEIERAGVADRVMLTTSVTFGARLVDRLVGALAIVLPSVWADTSDYALLESMALGKAVVVADGGGNAEIVLAARAGVVFTSGDATALSRVLDSIVERRYDLTAMGERGRQFVEREFGSSKFAERLTSLLEQLSVAGSRRGRQT